MRRSSCTSGMTPPARSSSRCIYPSEALLLTAESHSRHEAADRPSAAIDRVKDPAVLADQQAGTAVAATDAMKNLLVSMLLVLSACMEPQETPSGDCEGDNCDDGLAPGAELDANALFEIVQSSPPFAQDTAEAAAILAVVNTPLDKAACNEIFECAENGGHIGAALCTSLGSAIQDCPSGRALQTARKAGVVFQRLTRYGSPPPSVADEVARKPRSKACHRTNRTRRRRIGARPRRWRSEVELSASDPISSDHTRAAARTAPAGTAPRASPPGCRCRRTTSSGCRDRSHR